MHIAFKNVKDAETIIELLVSMGKLSYSNYPPKVYAKYLIESGYDAINLQDRSYSTMIGRSYDFCGGNKKGNDLVWGKDTDKILRKILNGSKEIIIKDVGDYEAKVSDEGIQVGCQHITHEKFKEIADAVAKVLE